MIGPLNCKRVRTRGLADNAAAAADPQVAAAWRRQNRLLRPRAYSKPWWLWVGPALTSANTTGAVVETA